MTEKGAEEKALYASLLLLQALDITRKRSEAGGVVSLWQSRGRDGMHLRMQEERISLVIDGLNETGNAYLWAFSPANNGYPYE